MDGAGLMLLLRVALSLACVVGLIWFAGRRLSGNQARRTPAGPSMRVVGRQALGRHAGVAVVAIGNRRLLLGYGEQQVTMLTELAPVMEPAPLPVAARPAAAAPTSSLPTARVAPESLLSGQPSARPALDIDVLLAQARLDAEAPAVSVDSAPTAPEASAVRALVPAVGSPLGRGALDGSILSLDTWRRALATLQDRTVRR